jgi:hypothetical protein
MNIFMFAMGLKFTELVTIRTVYGSLIKDSVTRFFVFGFLHQTTTPGLHRHVHKRCQMFFLTFRGVIQIRNSLSADEYTRESILIPYRR